MESAAELEACLKSVDEMIVKAKALADEYRERDPRSSAEIPTYENSITFAELRDLAQNGKEALERALPDNPKLLRDWYVPETEDLGGPLDVLTDLTRKRGTLVHARNLLGVTPEVPDPPAPRSRWRTFADHFDFIPKAIVWIGGVGGGIAIIVLVVDWTLGLF